MRFATVRIQRSEHHMPVVDIGEWEIPMLQYEYSPEKVEILSFGIDGRPYPGAQDEYVRLSNKYGDDVESGNAKASIVFGQGMMGVNSLARLISDAQTREAEGVAEAENAALAVQAAAAAEEARIAALVEARAAQLAAEKQAPEKSKTLSLK